MCVILRCARFFHGQFLFRFMNLFSLAKTDDFRETRTGFIVLLTNGTTDCRQTKINFIILRADIYKRTDGCLDCSKCVLKDKYNKQISAVTFRAEL